MSDAVVELSGVTKRFDGVTAVRDLSFEVREGEFFSLLGPSGCGKSTTLRTVAGFETPTEGTVRIDGRDVTGVPAHERDTGMVFQGYALFPHKTVGENVGFGLKMQGVDRDERRRRVADLLETVDLAGFEDRDPGELSGGQRQRVALARALIVEPSVLLLDEPLAALDRQLRQELRLELKRVQRELDVTTIYVTHDQEEALSMSDRIMVLDDGRARQVDSPRTLYHQPADEFVARFIGEANLLSVTVAAVDDDAVVLDVAVPGVGRLAVPRGAVTADGLAPGDDASLNVRPEHVRVEHPVTGATVGADGGTPDGGTPDGGTPDEPRAVDDATAARTRADAAGAVELSGELVASTFVGRSTQTVVDVGGVEIVAETSADDRAPAIGDPVGLSWSAADCTVVTAT